MVCCTRLHGGRGVGSYFRDLLRPITALPGAQSLHHMRVLASVTGMVSAAALMVSAPNRREREVSARSWVEGLERLLHYDDCSLPIGSATDAAMGGFKLLGMSLGPYQNLEDRYVLFLTHYFANVAFRLMFA